MRCSAADRPVESFGDTRCCEREIAEAEQVERLVERLLRVVVALEQVLARDAVVGLDQVDERLLRLARGSVGDRLVRRIPDTPSTLNTSTL